MTDFGPLRTQLAGDVLEPGSRHYEAARRPEITRFGDIRPQAVIRCASADDIARTLDFARRRTLHVVPRGGGHCFAGRSSTEGLVLDLSRLADVEVSAATTRIGAGARLAHVYDALHEHSLTLPAGCGPTVGIAGLTLGGGLGMLGRRYGLTADQLIAATVVLADGRIVDCDEHREPDLFWALRGAGGGQFGVVTSLLFDAVPEQEMTRFELTWPHSAAAAVVAAWQQWAPDAPDELTANLKIIARTGESLQVILFGTALLPTAATGTLLAHLSRSVGTPPASTATARMGYRELKQSLDGLGAPELAPPVLLHSKSEFFRSALPDPTIVELVECLLHGGRADVHRELAFTAMGGAYNRVLPDATAFVHRSERFLLEHVAVHTAGSVSANDYAGRWVRQSRAIAHDHSSGGVYPNFPDPELTGWAEAYHGDNLDRLIAVKHRYDADGFFRFPQCVPTS